MKTPALLLAIGVLATVGAACGSGDSNPTATLPPAGQPNETFSPLSVTEQVTEELGLIVTSPEDGDEVSSTAINVLGSVRPDATVAVNGRPVAVDVNGSWQTEIELIDPTTEIEITASTADGAAEFKSIVVFQLQDPASAQLLIQSPSDGQVVRAGTVTVSGTASPDAIVAVNGELAEVSLSGLFTADVELEPGANLIEVSSTLISGATAFKSIVVFRES